MQQICNTINTSFDAASLQYSATYAATNLLQHNATFDAPKILNVSTDLGTAVLSQCLFDRISMSSLYINYEFIAL